MYDATKKQLIESMREFMIKYNELNDAVGDSKDTQYAKMLWYKQAIDDIAILLTAL